MAATFAVLGHSNLQLPTLAASGRHATLSYRRSRGGSPLVGGCREGKALPARRRPFAFPLGRLCHSTSDREAVDAGGDVDGFAFVDGAFQEEGGEGVLQAALDDAF